MLRHFFVRLALAISLLPRRMALAPFETLLVGSVVFAHLLSAGLFTATRTAVTMSEVARHADEESRSTDFVATKTP